MLKISALTTPLGWGPTSIAAENKRNNSNILRFSQRNYSEKNSIPLFRGRQRDTHTLTEAMFAHWLQGISLRNGYIQLDCSHRRGRHLALKNREADNLQHCMLQCSPLSFNIAYTTYTALSYNLTIDSDSDSFFYWFETIITWYVVKTTYCMCNAITTKYFFPAEFFKTQKDYLYRSKKKKVCQFGVK